MQLLDARLCCNCETVYNTRDHKQCPRCADTHAINLYKSLNHGKKSLTRLHAKWRKAA